MKVGGLFGVGLVDGWGKMERLWVQGLLEVTIMLGVEELFENVEFMF